MNLIAERLARIEAVLNTVLPDSVDPPWLVRVAGQECPEVRLEEANLFLEPGRSLLRRGGKRWRPLITVLTCEALGGGRKADELVALSEIPHNGSLIIDDIEDSSLTRRGAPAIHLEYGIDLAVNMGNLMYFLPTIVLERCDFDAATKGALIQDWLAVMRRLHLGQGYDILWHRQAHLYPDRESYLRMCRFKTGSLSSLAARLGARAAYSGLDPNSRRVSDGRVDSDEGFIDALASVWEDLGTSFQILDDVQNLSSGIPGKDKGDDIVEGKKSLPVIFHASKRPDEKSRLTHLFARAAKGAPEGDWSAVDETIDLLEESGSIQDARDEGRVLLDSAQSRIRSLLPDGEARGLLLSLVDGFRETMI